MSPLARLLDRHGERLIAQPPDLWVNPPADVPGALLATGSTCFVQDESRRIALASRGFESQLGAFPTGASDCDRIFFALPREKARLRMMAKLLASRLRPGGSLLAAGEVRAGARSAQRHLAEAFGSVRKLDTARHCVLYEAFDPLPQGDLSPRAFLEYWSLKTPRGQLEISSLPGVFAHGGLDRGTALLLDTFDAILARRPKSVLDLGCGAGVIGTSLLRQAPDLSVSFVDDSALALEATRATLLANGFDGDVYASDGLSAFLDAEGGTARKEPRFDLLISNPPFHDGHRERDDLGAGVFAGFERVLRRGGQLVMVVNRHLPWRRWMERTSGDCETLASDGTYQVLRGTRR